MNNNMKYAFRNIAKNKASSIITVTGLSVAFACLLLIFLYVTQEFSYNNFHTNKDNIFRVNYSINWADGSINNTVLLNPELSKILEDKAPQVNRSTAFRSAHMPTMIFEQQNLEENLCITEHEFFDIFSFNVIYGNKSKLLTNPDEIVITKNLADKLKTISSCTMEGLLGKSVSFMNTGDQVFTISGILEDVPRNSSLQFSALIPFKYQDKFSWSSNMFGNSTIYYEINQKEAKAVAETQVSSVIQNYYQELIERMKGYKAFADTDDCFQPYMISLNNTYLDPTSSDYEGNNSKTSLYILSVIGLLILVIASSNFIMLSLGQAFKRVGQVGIRYTFGARKINIFSIFFSENLILSFTAFALGAVLCVLLLPTFINLAPNEIYTNLINIPQLVLFVTACLFIIALSTSIVPVLKLVNIQPNLLSSKKLRLGKGSSATQIFVTLQYGLSILLIILTISVVRQTNYMKHKDLGFSSENIIDLRIYHLNNSEKQALHDRLESYSGITNLTLTDRNYAGGRSSNGVTNSKGENIETRILTIDNNYISTLNLKLIEGKNFTVSNSDEKSVIINEKLLASLDLKDDPVGNMLKMDGENYRIVGVVKDFHYDSMKEGIMPLILRPLSLTNHGKRAKYIFLRYRPQQLATLLSVIQNTWKEIAPDKELDLKFWDEQLNNRYQAEEQWSRIIGYASLIAIIISSLGLFGLTLMAVNIRKKEIGIRKVNGAKTKEILAMLNGNFVKWIAIAFVIACPIAWYAMHKWLENFAYKTELSWWIFALAGLIALGIALLTVSFQAWQAATRNPVESLRYE
ncbi:ABC transporter permease [Labilibaculum euxinus]|uniref:FtsX-like permease family protein n=1 Tax=Labilibaculum euxinus TaxID=2686357 RepID=A0A7M4DB09_9BACT|nr:ABC transporter permease [Labilibaculum euxinus]MUP39838.1 FtsX-like permease family protein [Labilibaculum euxinus]MVB09043.1 FtsX-like permease family protein [Labilibaculum euxinus]